MPELSTIDEDYGQLEMINQENRDTYPLTYPAVLIDASEVMWSNIAARKHGGANRWCVTEAGWTTYAGEGEYWTLQGHRLDECERQHLSTAAEESD